MQGDGGFDLFPLGGTDIKYRLHDLNLLTGKHLFCFQRMMEQGKRCMSKGMEAL